MSEWKLTEEAHLAFSKFCATDRNAKAKALSDRFPRDVHITFVPYFTETANAKNDTQWKARMNITGVPIEVTMNTRSAMECGRVMALQLMCGLDHIPDAALKPRTNWITPEVEAFLA